MTQQSYTITLDDVQAYLDSKRDDEVIGVTCDGGKCLVAESLRMKYPGAQVGVGEGSFSIFPARAVKWAFAPMNEEIEQIIEDFDLIGFDEGGDSHEWAITKRQWIDAKAVQS